MKKISWISMDNSLNIIIIDRRRINLQNRKAIGCIWIIRSWDKDSCHRNYIINDQILIESLFNFRILSIRLKNKFIE